MSTARSLLALLPLAFESSALATPYFRLVPVQPQGLTAPPYPAGMGIVGDTVLLTQTPQRIWLEARFGGWGASTHRICEGGPNDRDPCSTDANCPGGLCLPAEALKTVQAAIAPLSLASGQGSPLVLADVPCNGDSAVCENELGDGIVLSFGDDQCVRENNTRCSPSFIQTGRADQIFLGIGGCAQSVISCGMTSNGPVIEDDGREYYLATFVLDVPSGAQGSYAVAFDPAGTFQQQQSGEILDEYNFSSAKINLCVGSQCGPKNRYVTLNPTNMPPAAQSGGGIRIRTLEVNGQSLPGAPAQWVGLPQAHLDAATGQTFYAAELTCSPFAFNWNSLPPDALLHVYGANVVPDASYEVRTADGVCIADPAQWDTCLTLMTFTRTAPFGDVVEPFGEGAPPSFLDISALVHAFKVLPTAVIKPRAQLAGTVPNPAGPVSFLDISAGVSAFKGESFPFAGPTACP